MTVPVDRGGDSELVVLVTLTEREQEVLRQLARGLSSKEIAKLLTITTRTVESHIEKIRVKTRTRNRTHMIAQALHLGLLRPDH